MSLNVYDEVAHELRRIRGTDMSEYNLAEYTKDAKNRALSRLLYEIDEPLDLDGVKQVLLYIVEDLYG